MTERRRVVLLGATGSIGRQACDVLARHADRFELVGAVARRDRAALQEVAGRFGLSRCVLVEPDDGEDLPAGWGRGVEAACEVAAMPSDVVCVAITGAAALQPSLAAIDAGRTLAIATKEVLVMAGDLVRERATGSGARLIPVDSEHSAVWQCLRGEDIASVARIVLTASGGPFLDRAAGTLGSVTPAEALRHPTWDMGPKVTVDSATMMNKGLEVIEAHHLFGVGYSQIEVVIHPDSLVHSYVEFCDGAIIAQVGVPDMRVPIALALSDGERLPGIGMPLDLRHASPLRFLAVDGARFPAVQLARSAGERGGLRPAVLNAANEVAVAAFLEGRAGFDDIVPLVAEAVDAAPPADALSLETILEADAWARDRVRAQITERVTAG